MKDARTYKNVLSIELGFSAEYARIWITNISVRTLTIKCTFIKRVYWEKKKWSAARHLKYSNILEESVY